MAQVRINHEVKERDYETVYYGNVPHTITKTFNKVDSQLGKHLFEENYKRKKHLNHDYYDFQFDSGEIGGINDLATRLKDSSESEPVKEETPMKEPKTEDVQKEEVKVELEVKPIVQEKKKTSKRKYGRKLPKFL